MEHYSKKISDQSLVQIVESNPNLLILWNEVENKLSNCLLYLITSKEYAQKTQNDKSNTHYGFVNITPLPDVARLPKNYLATIVVAPDALEADIGHELMHLFIHGVGYPYIWHDYKYGEAFTETPEIKETATTITRIYDIAVHPLIDQFLIKRNLFNAKVWERMHKTYIDELNIYLKNPDSFLNKNYIILRTIELQHRLPQEMWLGIYHMFTKRTSFQRLMNNIEELPTFPTTLSSENIHNYITSLWAHFRLNPNQLNLSLQTDTPLSKTPHKE